MGSNLDKYIPEFDEDEARNKVSGFTREQLIDMLIHAYKEKRVLAKSWDESLDKLRRIGDVLDEPSRLRNMPGIPSAQDLRRMIDDEKD